MTDREYYEYICSSYNKINTELSEKELAQLDKILVKIDSKIRKLAMRGEQRLIISYTWSDYMDCIMDGYGAIKISERWRAILKKTLFKRLKEGGFRIYDAVDYTGIKWIRKE